MYFLLWLRRFFLSSGKFISFTPLVSIFSLVLAVSCLVLGMSVYSGYESTLNRAIQDMTSDMVISRGEPAANQNLFHPIRGELEEARAHSPFLHLKSLLTYEGRLTAALLEGLDPQSMHQVLSLKKRLVAGSFELKKPRQAVIGRGLAKKFQLNPGDRFHIIVPEVKKGKPLSSRHQELVVEGVMDFGFHEFNTRQILVSLQTARNLLPLKGAVSGLRVLFPKDMTPLQIHKWQNLVKKKLGPPWQVSRWGFMVKSISETYLHTVKREKFIIFFILMILVLAGCFNVSSHLSISVLNQTQEISILRAMGAKAFFIMRLFLIQGFLIGLVGAVAGIFLGLALSKGLIALQNIWPLVPQDIYHVSSIVASARFSDLVLVLICSQVVCFLACLGPALKVFKMPLTQGLQN